MEQQVSFLSPGVAEKLTALTDRFEKMSQLTEKVAAAFDGVDNKLATMIPRLGRVAEVVDKLNTAAIALGAPHLVTPTKGVRNPGASLAGPAAAQQKAAQQVAEFLRGSVGPSKAFAAAQKSLAAAAIGLRRVTAPEGSSLSRVLVGRGSPGDIGGHLASSAQTIGHLTLGGALGAAAPAAFATTAGSARLLSAALGQMLIPAAVQLSSRLQAVAAWVHSLTDETKEAVGKIAGWGVAAGALTVVFGPVISGIAGLASATVQLSRLLFGAVGGLLGLVKASLALVGVSGVTAGALAFIATAAYAAKLALEKMADQMLEEAERRHDPGKATTRAELESDPLYQRVAKMKEQGASPEQIRAVVTEEKARRNTASLQANSAVLKAQRGLDQVDVWDPDGVADKLKTALGNETNPIATGRRALDEAQTRAAQTEKSAHTARMIEEEVLYGRRFQPRGAASRVDLGGLGEALFGKVKGPFLPAMMNPAQPSYSAIEESYRKIQLSALNVSPLEAETRKYQAESLQIFQRQAAALDRLGVEASRQVPAFKR